MKIGLQTWGTDGDVNPFIALAAGLAAAGHRVTLVVTTVARKDYRPLAGRLGFTVVQAGYIGRNEEAIGSTLRSLFATSDPLRQLGILFDRMLEPGADMLGEAAQSLCRENDLVVGHPVLYPLQAAAERSDRPHLTVSLVHSFIPTRSLPLGGFPNLGSFGNALLWRLGLALVDRRLLPLINRFRLRAGLPAAAHFRSVMESRRGNLIAVSRVFCGEPADWEPHQHVCGFFEMPDAARPGVVTDELRRFLDAGPPPVYLTLGSMHSVETDAGAVAETNDLLSQAALRAGCRAIIQSQIGEPRFAPPHADIFRITSAPHAAIFPRCAAVVHHGGAGTTHQATRSGCPSVVVAHVIDQFFWAQTLHRIGVAPRPLEHRSVTPEKLARAIRRVLDTPDMKKRAAECGAIMRRENGVGTAVSLIEQACVP